MKRGEVAEKKSVGRGFFDQPEISCFARFEDARCGEVDAGIWVGVVRAELGDGVFETSWVLEVAVDGVDFAFDGGGELLEVATKHG